MYKTVILLAAIVVSAGCTHIQLRRNTVNQMSTVHELQQQQVLDNLAMFVHNRNSYPYFSIVVQGTSTLTDTGTLAVTDAWARTGGHLLYSALGANPTASRAAAEAWTINPINDSVKLTLMRCCYQRAVDGCMGGPPSGNCPDCEHLLQEAYAPPTPTGSQSVTPPSEPAGETIQGQKVSHRKVPVYTDDQCLDEPSFAGPQQPESSSTFGPITPVSEVPDPRFAGIVTPECIRFRGCWFCYGHKIPKPYRKCALVGHYCGTYVWIPPQHVDELTKLTLLIQDIAFYVPGGGGKTSPAPAFGEGGGESGPFNRQPSNLPYTALGTLQILRAYSPTPAGF
jgi:hypothetical protein